LSTSHVLNCLDDVHGYLAALNLSVLDMFPFFVVEFVCLVSLLSCYVCDVVTLLYSLILPRSAKG